MRACVLLSSIIDCHLSVTYATGVRWAGMLANGLTSMSRLVTGWDLVL